jgi:hypothetical protein
MAYAMGPRLKLWCAWLTPWDPVLSAGGDDLHGGKRIVSHQIDAQDSMPALKTLRCGVRLTYIGKNVVTEVRTAGKTLDNQTTYPLRYEVVERLTTCFLRLYIKNFYENVCVSRFRVRNGFGTCCNVVSNA